MTGVKWVIFVGHGPSACMSPGSDPVLMSYAELLSQVCYVYVRVCMCVSMHTCVYVCICVNDLIFICVICYLCMYICVGMCVHTVAL